MGADESKDPERYDHTKRLLDSINAEIEMIESELSLKEKESKINKQ